MWKEYYWLNEIWEKLNCKWQISISLGTVLSLYEEKKASKNGNIHQRDCSAPNNSWTSNKFVKYTLPVTDFSVTRSMTSTYRSGNPPIFIYIKNQSNLTVYQPNLESPGLYSPIPSRSWQALVLALVSAVPGIS